MIDKKERAEGRVIDALREDEFLRKLYYPRKMFQGYVAPNTLSSLKEYIFLSRISTVPLDTDYVDGLKGATLRRVRLQIDVYDKSFTDMVERSERVCDVLRAAFPSCLDGTTNGVVRSGQSTWNVTSIDVILTEKEERDGC